MTRTYNLQLVMWLYPGKAGWYFVSLPPEIATEIDYFFSMDKKGWGSLPVMVTAGKTEWCTSIFPDKKSHSYLLPIKASVRKSEQLAENDTVSLVITIKN